MMRVVVMWMRMLMKGKVVPRLITRSSTPAAAVHPRYLSVPATGALSRVALRRNRSCD